MAQQEVKSRWINTTSSLEEGKTPGGREDKLSRWVNVMGLTRYVTHVADEVYYEKRSCVKDHVWAVVQPVLSTLSKKMC